MIHYNTEMPVSERTRVLGGTGSYQSLELFSKADVGGRARLFAVNTMPKGSSIGVHPHTGEGEAYVILQGEAVVTEDGKEYILHAGDAEYCTDGHSHGIENRSDKPLVFLALIMVNPT